VFYRFGMRTDPKSYDGFCTGSRWFYFLTFVSHHFFDRRPKTSSTFVPTRRSSILSLCVLHLSKILRRVCSGRTYGVCNEHRHSSSTDLRTQQASTNCRRLKLHPVCIVVCRLSLFCVYHPSGILLLSHLRFRHFSSIHLKRSVFR
jgi:hypothetical protein